MIDESYETLYTDTNDIIRTDEGDCYDSVNTKYRKIDTAKEAVTD